MTIPGYSLLRLIADRERSKLYLARDQAGTFCALKLQRAWDAARVEQLLQRNQRLQPLTRNAGLLEILDYGKTDDHWVWKKLPLADPLPGLPALDTAEGQRSYSPLTLPAWRTVHSPPGAATVARWGVRLAEALGTLHRAGLVHRDVKPANVLFVLGAPCLGDYGLVGEPGESIDYRGTEGYRPLEGTSDAGADLFALGKTLYEVWTGMNRLEFPSLPKTVLDSPEWNATGSRLNDIILRACAVQPSKRYSSAEDLSRALNQVLVGPAVVNRRKWLASAATLSVAAAGAFLFLKHSRPPARVIWRRLRQTGFNVESWQGHMGTADWQQGQIYSFCVDNNGRTFEAVDLAGFNLTVTPFSEGPTQSTTTILHPQTGELWIIEGGNGEVYALDPRIGAMRSLGGGPHDDRHFANRAYWNSYSHRVGVFGGYGKHSVCNDRCEFDRLGKHWVTVEPDGESEGRPWRRVGAIPLVPDSTGRKLYLVGGNGSRTGKQGDRMPGIRGFNGAFHLLDDIWELDLRLNSWRCVLPLGHFDPVRLLAAAYLPNVEGLVILEGIKPEDQEASSARAWLLRPGIDKEPVGLPANGDPSHLAQAWAYATNPTTGEMLLFANDGIFSLAVQKV